MEQATGSTNLTQIAGRADDALLARIEARRKAERRSRSQLLLVAVEYYLDHAPEPVAEKAA